MTYIFKRLNENTTFEQFRNEFKKIFDYDYYDSTDPEDIPTGPIKNSNNEWVKIKNNQVELWIDDGDNSEEII